MFPETPRTLLRKIASFARGDDEAVWFDFVTQYTPALRRFIQFQNGTLSSTEVDDVVQEVFVRLVDVLREQRYDSKKARFRTYLATLMRRLLIDRFRAQQTRETAERQAIKETVVGEGVDVETTGGVASVSSIGLQDPGEILDLKWRVAVHEAAVEQVLSNPLIEPRSKDAYRALIASNESVAAIAARFGLTPNALSQLKARFDRAIAAAEAMFV